MKESERAKAESNPHKNPKLVILVVILALVIFFWMGSSVMPAENFKIGIRPVGNIDPDTLKYLKGRVEKAFSCKAEILPAMSVPDRTYDADRGQYKAFSMVQFLRTFKNESKYRLIIGVVDKDLYASRLNFVFGLAHPSSGSCIISLTRLRPRYYGQSPDKELFKKRMAKEAVHELGHLCGMDHCDDDRCVMKFSNSLYDTDRKSAQFCEKHKRELREFQKNPIR